MVAGWPAADRERLLADLLGEHRAPPASFEVAEGGGAGAELPSAEEVRVERLQQELQVAQQAVVEAKPGEAGDVPAAGAAERSARAVGAGAAPSRRAPKAARVATPGPAKLPRKTPPSIEEYAAKKAAQKAVAAEAVDLGPRARDATARADRLGLRDRVAHQNDRHAYRQVNNTVRSQQGLVEGLQEELRAVMQARATLEARFTGALAELRLLEARQRKATADGTEARGAPDAETARAKAEAATLTLTRLRVHVPCGTADERSRTLCRTARARLLRRDLTRRSLSGDRANAPLAGGCVFHGGLSPVSRVGGRYPSGTSRGDSSDP
ncbi:hypothetical protein Esi_0000_0280 [Ectocarpus siliculosus]|uniref:Uncharacterized protein n=1 Tax=Ectocarpus siliculosus TaxID=2880 RepID=D8LB70_ECTSI|nr:hypothetical protein Esi_0000_0280 [Ectocarpus siliculosus]|eukprot:CBN76579.1 hypothetical protein Esi_0000_0280 [Ectocarpus siliculosus]